MLKWKGSHRIKAIQEESGDRWFSGFVSTREVDRVGDVVEPTAWTATLKASDLPVPVLLNHDYDRILGKIERDQFEIREEGVYVKRGDIRPAGQAQYVDEAWSAMKFGALNSQSFGFAIVSADERRDDDGHATGGLRITELDLYETTIATVPANPGAVLEYDASSPIVKALQKELMASIAPSVQRIEANVLREVKRALPLIVATTMQEIADQEREVCEEEVLVRSMARLERGMKAAARFSKPGSAPAGME